MKRYRVDFFGRDLVFKSFSEASEPDITLDYLVQTNSSFECPNQVVCSRGDFAQIRVDGTVYHQGIITDIIYDGHKTEITLQQMSALLDVDVFADVTLLNNGTKDIETWFADLLAEVFNGTDTFQNVVGFTVTKNSSTYGSKRADDKGIYNLYDLAVYFFKTYGVIVSINFDYATQTTTFVFDECNATAVSLNLKVTDVEKYDVEMSVSESAPNKMIIKNEDDATEVQTFYWHPSDFSGTVNTDGSTNRVTPVVTKCQTVKLQEGETFASVALETARNNMYQSRYDDLITITLRANSKLVSIPNIGQQYTLYTNENVYYTVLTGIHAINMKYVELTFGYVRKRLTQILRMKG